MSEDAINNLYAQFGVRRPLGKQDYGMPRFLPPWFLALAINETQPSEGVLYLRISKDESPEQFPLKPFGTSTMEVFFDGNRVHIKFDEVVKSLAKHEPITLSIEQVLDRKYMPALIIGWRDVRTGE